MSSLAHASSANLAYTGLYSRAVTWPSGPTAELHAIVEKPMKVPISRTGKSKRRVMKAALYPVEISTDQIYVNHLPFQTLAKRLMRKSRRLTSCGTKSFREPKLKLCLERGDHVV